jgi:electron transport complex protein RnfC
MPAVVIESDGRDEWGEKLPPRKDYLSLTPDEIRKIIREAGIVGLGGAAFPTQVKLSPPQDKKIEMVILNGCECEPYLTADFRLMQEKPREIIEGLKIIMHVLGVAKSFIGIEDNKPEAVDALQAVLGKDSPISLVKLKTKYPQGSEKHLIKAITNRETPSGGLPLDVGIVVNNVGTAVAIFEAVVQRKPLIDRVITVSGEAIKEPQNFRVRIGTPFSFVVENAGGMVGNPGKIIMGGPMMGIAQSSLEVPVIKGTTAILVLPAEKVGESGDCIRCGRCIESCPMNLLPNFIGLYVERNRLNGLENYHVMDCIECGCCAYVCPTRRPLVQYIKQAKAEITRKKGASKPG